VSGRNDLGLSLDRIGIDESAVRKGTAKVAENGKSIQYVDMDGDPFVIDGSSLRYLADPLYSQEVDEGIKSLHIPVSQRVRYQTDASGE
jgi:hypothetical protein